MARNVKIAVTDATGGTIAIASDPNREELIIRNGGSDRCYLAFNEDAVDDQGVYLESGDAIVLSSGNQRWARATAAIYAVCTTGETCSLYADITS
jgi:hypothetical protein